MALLEGQKALIEKHNSLPMVRDRIEPTNVVVIPVLKDYMEKARKIHQRLFQLQEFEFPLDLPVIPGHAPIALTVITQQELTDLINALKINHEFLAETETVS
jgi:hypothetical protein